MLEKSKYLIHFLQRFFNYVSSRFYRFDFCSQVQSWKWVAIRHHNASQNIWISQKYKALPHKVWISKSWWKSPLLQKHCANLKQFYSKFQVLIPLIISFINDWRINSKTHLNMIHTLRKFHCNWKGLNLLQGS